MKLTFSTLVCPNWSLPQIVGAAAAHGLEGIDPRGMGAEIDITRLPRFDGELDSTMELLAEHHLCMPCLNSSVTLVTSAPERWEMMLDECRRYAVLAGRLGSRLLRIFGGSVPKGMTRAEAVHMSRRHLRQLIHICQPHRLRPLLETHDQWATTPQILELIGGFSPQEVGALWDIDHPYRHGEKPADTAMSLGDYLQHVHFKDNKEIDGHYIPQLLGEGDLPLGEILAALRQVGYDQWICLETEKRWHPQTAPEPEQSLPQFVEYMKGHWGE